MNPTQRPTIGEHIFHRARDGQELFLWRHDAHDRSYPTYQLHRTAKQSPSPKLQEGFILPHAPAPSTGQYERRKIAHGLMIHILIVSKRFP